VCAHLPVCAPCCRDAVNPHLLPYTCALLHTSAAHVEGSLLASMQANAAALLSAKLAGQKRKGPDVAAGGTAPAPAGHEPAAAAAAAGPDTVAAAAAAGPDSVAAAVAAAAAPMRLQRAGEEAALAGEQDLMHNSALAAAWQDQGLAVGGRDPWPPSAGDTTAARAWQAPRQLTGTSSWQPPPACTAGGDQMLQLVQAEAGARAPFT